MKSFLFGLQLVIAAQFLGAQELVTTIPIVPSVRVDLSGVMGTHKSFVGLSEAKLDSGMQKITFVFFDNHLKEMNRIVCKVDRGEKFEKSYSDSTGIYAVYAKKNGTFSLIFCDGISTKQIKGSFGSKAECRGIKGCNCRSLIYIAEKTNNYLLIADFNTGKQSYVFLNKDPKLKASIQNISWLPLAKEFSVVYLISAPNKRQLHVLLFTDQLEKKHDFILGEAATNERFLITAIVTGMGNNSYLINGSYQDHENQFPDGLYLGKFQEGKWIAITYSSFSNDFSHFLDFIPEREHVLRKQKKAQRRGKDFQVGVMVLSHPAQQFAHSYVVLSEVYVPQFTTEMDNEGGCHTEFAGYLFSHLIAVGYNDSLLKKWDQSVALNIFSPGVEWIQPEKVVRTDFNENILMAIYSNGTVFHKLRIDESGSLKEDESITANGMDEVIQLRELRDTKIRYWYASSFLATGNARLKENKRLRKEKVYYLRLINFKDEDKRKE